MTTHSPAFTAPQRQQQHGSPDLNSQRAAFLSGLRTGGPRSVSPRPSTDEPPSSLYCQDSLGRLKANAAVFKPSGPNSPPLGNARADQHVNGLEEQLAALRMHALVAQNQANVNNYGTQYQDERAIAHARQQQQDQQQLQIQLTMMQLQAQHQQHQQQQHVAAQHQQQQQQHQQQQQQQFMLAKLHAEYERQNQGNSPDSDGLHHLLGEHQQHASAQEQRQAAQASIQNSLRYRQAQAQQQIYQAILDGQQNGKQQRVDAQALLYQQQQQQQHQHQQQQIQQQLLYAQLQAQAQAQAVQAQALAQVPLEQRSWRSSVTHSRTQTPPSVRSGSPAAQGQGATNGNVHKKAADSASSWRKTKTPSIVVDDSASDTQGSATDSETPETSEENAPSFNFKAPTNMEHSTSASAGGRVHSLPPRAISIVAAPRNRAFAEQGPSRVASEGSSQTTIHPQRQPNGPPSDVKPTNFAARMSQRTRREALSKLNALVRSPRTVAAFSGIAAPAA